MFPLEINHYPTTADELLTALTEAGRKLLIASGDRAPITFTGSNWKSADLLRFDLDNAVIRPDARPHRPGLPQNRRPGFAVRKLEISANPIRYQNTTARFTLAASNVAFDFANDPSGQILAVLAAASDGRIEASIGKSDLESALLAAAKLAPNGPGIAFERIELSFTSTGPRSVQFEARVTAKKVFTAIVRIVGHLQIDDQLTANLSGLTASGEGMAGKMVVGFVQPMLSNFNNRPIPLTSFSLGDLRLRDLKISTPNGLQVEATFGNASS